MEATKRVPNIRGPCKGISVPLKEPWMENITSLEKSENGAKTSNFKGYNPHFRTFKEAENRSPYDASEGHGRTFEGTLMTLIGPTIAFGV